jgi:hypothetical protein
MRDLREQLGGECVLAYNYEPLACDVVKVMVGFRVRLRLGAYAGVGSRTRLTASLCSRLRIRLRAR